MARPHRDLPSNDTLKPSDARVKEASRLGACRLPRRVYVATPGC